MTSIRKLPQLNDKIVRFVHPDPDGNFFLVACHDYDQNLDIVYSETDKFEVDFYRNIEPNIIDVHDMNTQITSHNKCTIRLGSCRDGGFSMDQASFTLCKNRKKNIVQIDTNEPIKY